MPPISTQEMHIFRWGNSLRLFIPYLNTWKLGVNAGGYYPIWGGYIQGIQKSIFCIFEAGLNSMAKSGSQQNLKKRPRTLDRPARKKVSWRFLQDVLRPAGVLLAVLVNFCHFRTNLYNDSS